MNKKVYKLSNKDKDFIIKLIREAKERLNMQSWVIDNYFDDGEITGDILDNGNTFITSVLSTVTFEYEKITISWKPQLLKDILDKQYAEVKDCVYHELIHGLTQELYSLSLKRFVKRDDCTDAVERLTQRITRIVCTETSRKKKK